MVNNDFFKFQGSLYDDIKYNTNFRDASFQSTSVEQRKTIRLKKVIYSEYKTKQDMLSSFFEHEIYPEKY